MKIEQAIEFVNHTLFTQLNRRLNTVETLILRGSWAQQTYEEIAREDNYSGNYLRKDVGPKLWRDLTTAMGEPISKKNFRAALERSLYKETVLTRTPSTQAAQTQPPHTQTIPLEQPEGPTALGSPLYIERPPIEADGFDTILQPGALIRIKAPRQMGKTSLMMRVLDHAKQNGLRGIHINFRSAERLVLSDLSQCLQWLCLSITEKLDLPDRLAEYWKGPRGLIRRCDRYLENYILTELDQPIALGLDEVDQIFQHPDIAADFLGMLRAWHEEGKNNPLWQKLRLVIVHSKEVYIPLNLNRSPFNVGLPIELRELEIAEVDALTRQHGLQCSSHQLHQLMMLVGGHPYLLRLALYTVARQRMTFEDFLDSAPTEAGVYCDHLRRHLLTLEADPSLLTEFKTVLAVDQPVTIHSTAAFKLHSMGLIKYQGNSVVPLCNLYRQYFSDRLAIQT